MPKSKKMDDWCEQSSEIVALQIGHFHFIRKEEIYENNNQMGKKPDLRV